MAGTIEYECNDGTVTVTYTLDGPGSWWAETNGTLIEGAGNYGEGSNAGFEEVTYDYLDGLVAYVQTDSVVSMPVTCELPYTGLPAGLLLTAVLLLVGVGQKLVRTR